MNPITVARLLFSFLGCFNIINAASIPSNAALIPSNGRSVEGVNVDIREYPYQVALLYSSSPICAGSILNRKWVLTAAHCLSRSNFLLRYSVRAGSNYRNTGGVSVPVVSTRTHSRYNSGSLDYDIGVAWLQSELTYGSSIRPVELPLPNDYIRPRTTATTTGWEDDVSGSHLRGVSVQIIDNDVCQDSYYDSRVITDNMICAGFASSNTCQGESGEPLVASEYGQLGIASWGNDCGRAGPYGVYTRVSAFRTWINSQTGV
ncbi:trypsin-2-like [Agrilus planipennis]|uniref:Trypsin-2-like n=1 Tax=Agrilus planipennis TaxID=224129 RepID=A0A1W4XBV7_AGRPL|nr:trypsin-2-like [Agrilus planipennis]